MPPHPDDLRPQSEARRLAIANGELDFLVPESAVSPDDLAEPSAAMRPGLMRVSLPPDLARLAPAPGASAGRHRRFKRDLILYLAHHAGLSQRFIAEAIEMPRSQVAAIIAKFETALSPETDPR